MSAIAAPTATPEAIHYPDSDGEPMAENTVQYEWIVTIKGNLDILLRDRADAFVAGDNLIYPVEGHPEVRQAPDVYVALGRPKGHRGSYMVWKEGGTFPQVLFEVLSPGNRPGELQRKFHFYERHGAQEYYVYDPDDNALEAWVRAGDKLVAVPRPDGHVSPLLGIRFEAGVTDLAIRYPDGRRFLTFLEIGTLQAETQAEADRERQRADREGLRADREGHRADHEKLRADEEFRRAERERRTAADERARAEGEGRRAERLAVRLRELGLDPDAAE